MKAATLLRSARASTTRTISRSSKLTSTPVRPPKPASATSIYARTLVSSPATRAFCSSPVTFKGIQPDSSEPQPPNTESPDHSTHAAQLSDAEYHEIADQYLDTLVLALEELSEKATDGVEVEFSVRPQAHFLIPHPVLS